MFKYVIPSNDIETPNDNSKFVVRNDYVEKASMARMYNYAIDKFKKEIGFSDDFYIVFMHDDITIIDPNFEAKIELVMNKDPKTMILGVIGTSLYNLDKNHPGWWLNHRSTHGAGRIMQGTKTGESYEMLEVLGKSFKNNMIVVDGCVFVIRSTFFNEHRFDENIEGFHHYDNDICLQAIKDGFNVSVADLLVKHDSVGEMNELYNIEAVKLKEKWVDKFSWPLYK